MKTYELNLSVEDFAKVVKTLCPLTICDGETINPDNIREIYKLRLGMLGIESKIGVPSDAYPFRLVGDNGYYVNAYIADEDGNSVVYLGKMCQETGEDVWSSESLKIIG